jgi:hypothetical protein
MAQYLRPEADITTTGIAGGTYASIDETSATDTPAGTEFVYGSENVAVTYEVRLSDATDPAVHTGHTFRYRIVSLDGTTPSVSAAVYCTASLYQGSTLIKADTQKTTTDSWVTYTLTLAESEADDITDYTDLRLRFVSPASGGSAAARRALGISWAEMEVPNAIAAPTVTTQACSGMTTSGATGNGNITATGGSNATRRGFCYVAGTSGDPTTANSVAYDDGDFGTGAYTKAIAGLSAGTAYRVRAYAVNSAGTGYGTTVQLYTLCAAPTSVAATDGTYTDKVTITWTKSTGATGYKVYEGSNLLDTLGDVATYDDTAASAPTITAGTAAASDGTSTSYVTLSISGEGTSNGASRTYKVKAVNSSGDSADSSTDTGYRGVGSLTYQWQRSAADSDASYSNISSGTTDPYNDTDAPADGSGRYYKCVLSATGASNGTTNADRGYRTVNTPPTLALDYPTDTATISDTTPQVKFTGTDSNGDTIRYTIQIDSVDTFNNMDYADCYSEENWSFDSTVFGVASYAGQSFYGDGSNLDTATFYLAKYGTISGSVYAVLFAHSGTYGTSSVATGSALSTSDAVNTSVLTTSNALITFTFNGSYVLSNGTPYIICVYFTGGDPGNKIQIGADNTSPSHGGNSCSKYESTWYAYDDEDLCFYINRRFTLIEAISGTDDGFVDITDGADTDPFDSGDQIGYTVQDADTLSPDTYYWRVKGIDPSGSNTYGSWSSTYSFTITSGETVPLTGNYIYMIVSNA